jgi:uncharacterized repeat protein (TIGR01451 family)
VGLTSSDETTFPATRGPNVIFTGRFIDDAFVAKVGEGNASDLAISMLDTPDPVYTAGQLTYTITISNAGPSLATSVTITDTVPFQPAHVVASQGSCTGATTITCALGSLAVAATATVTVTVSPLQEGQISSSASVSADQADSNLGNNQAAVSTSVRRRTSFLALVHR